MARGLLDDQRNVVENRIRALELLESGDADASGHEVAVLAAEEHGHGTLTVRSLFFLEGVTDLCHLCVNLVSRADVTQHLAGLLNRTVADEETRRFRQAQHAEEQDDGRHGGEAEHEAPGHVTGDILQQVIHDVGNQHARDDHRLVQTGETAAQPRRCHLRHIGRDERRSRADREAEQDADADQVVRPMIQC